MDTRARFGTFIFASLSSDDVSSGARERTSKRQLIKTLPKVFVGLPFTLSLDPLSPCDKD